MVHSTGRSPPRFAHPAAATSLLNRRPHHGAHVHLTLLVPELIWPEPADQFTLGKLALPGLEYLLGRAHFERQPRRPYEQTLAACVGLADACLAPFRLLGDGLAMARDGHWLCADPVHLRFHHERIILADAGAFELELDEARELTSALNREFADIGEFHLGDARRWYLRLHVAVDHPVPPLSAVAGRRIDGALPTDNAPLTRWLNEVQMFLHGQAVNERRQGAGKPAINSLWLWGGGGLATGWRNSDSPSSLWSNDPLAAGLALASDLPRHPRPATLADVLKEGGPTPLVVLDQLLSRVLYEDSEGWRAAMTDLDQHWFGPLRKALGKPVDRVSLIAPGIYGELHFTVNAGDRWKFWKSGCPVSDIAHRLADPQPDPSTPDAAA
jgi:hypothetical protein